MGSSPILIGAGNKLIGGLSALGEQEVVSSSLISLILNLC